MKPWATSARSIWTAPGKAARKRFAAVTLGSDPAADKAQAKIKAKRTLGAVIEEYLAFKEGKLRPKSLQETIRYLRKSWKPLHGVPIHKVERGNLAVHLRRIASESGGVSVNRAQTALSSMYTWAMKEGLTDNNPVIATNRQAEEKPRERALSETELAKIWNALPSSDYGRIMRLLVLTGQRRNEIGGLRWSETGIYNKAVYAQEKREALTLWADYVRSLVEGTERKIVPLRSGEGAA